MATQFERTDDRSLRRWAAFVAGACCFGVALHGAAAAAATPSPRSVIAITDVTVIDVERGRSIGPRTVIVDAGRIVTVAVAGNVHMPADAQLVDGRGKFLIPGLVDMHVHLFNGYSKRPPNDWTFPLFVANGVTAVREMNAGVDDIATVRQWRTQAGAGTLVAPRILAAGVAANGRTPEEARLRVDAAADAGADFIKVFSDVPAAQWKAILDEAHLRSLTVAGHVPAGIPLLVAAHAGQRTAEHLMQAYEACSTIETSLIATRTPLTGDALTTQTEQDEARVLAAFDPSTCKRIARALQVTGQVQVPTLALMHAEGIRNPKAPADDPRWRYLRPDERARWIRIGVETASDDRELAQRRWQVTQAIALAFHRAHVSMLAGTDTPMPNIYPGFSLQEEMALLVDVGFTPREALRAATLAPAEFLGMAADTGSVAPGKRADLVLLDADPVRDIRNLERIDAVVFDGRLLRRSDLDALLAQAALLQQGNPRTPPAVTTSPPAPTGPNPLPRQ